MLKSGKTINEVFKVLSVTKSTYKDIFQKTYRIWLRDPDDGFDYLDEQFKGTLLSTTVMILRNFNDYDRNETIRTLENNREEIIEYSKNARKKAEAGANLLNQVAVIFPFVSVVLLAVGPIFYWALALFSQAGVF